MHVCVRAFDCVFDVCIIIEKVVRIFTLKRSFKDRERDLFM